jgi:hypothetical protein
MPIRPIAAAAVAAAAALVAAGGAGAAGAPLPSPTSFLLTPSDFGPAAQSADLEPIKISGVTEYLRSFSKRLRAGSEPLGAAGSLAMVAPDASSAYDLYMDLEVSSHTAAGRRLLARYFTAGFAPKLGAKERVLKTTVGAARYQTDVVIFPIAVKMNVGTFRMLVAVTHVERVVGALLLISTSGRTVSNAAVDLETAAMRKHLTDAFTVANTGLPTVSGPTVQGQTLTVDEGVWSGAPTSYTYAWSRCSNGTCTPIDGANARTYAVGTDDSGSTLQVAVTATNTVGSATAVAAPTAVVQ